MNAVIKMIMKIKSPSRLFLGDLLIKRSKHNFSPEEVAKMERALNNQKQKINTNFFNQ